MSDYVNIDTLTVGDNGFTGFDLNQMMAIFATYSLVVGLISLLVIVELWLIYKKSGKPGWAAIVPIYNAWVLLEIADLPGWLSLIPVANLIGMLVAYFKIPKKFGKSAAFGLGIMFFPFIFLGILAFGKSKTQDKMEDSSATFNNAPAMDNVPIMSETPINNSAAPDTAAPDLMAAPVVPTNNEINTIESEKNYAQEEPALNLEETPSVAMPSVEPINNNVITNEPEPMVNAFEMTSPVQTENINSVVNEPVNNSLNQNAFNEPIVNNVENTFEQFNASSNQNIFDQTPVQNSVSSVEPSNSEEEFEMPKMANEVINSDITTKKICKNCSHENPYTSKFCEMCGSTLE